MVDQRTTPSTTGTGTTPAVSPSTEASVVSRRLEPRSVTNRAYIRDDRPVYTLQAIVAATIDCCATLGDRRDDRSDRLRLRSLRVYAL